MLLKAYRNALNYKDDQNPSLGFSIKFLQYTLVWRHGRSRFKTNIFYFIIITCYCYLTNLVVNLIINFNFDIGIWFVQYSALHLGLLKISTIIKNRKNWENLTNYMAEIDIRATKAHNAKNFLPILLKFRRYCSKCSVLYVVAFIVINVPFISLFLINNIILPLLVDNSHTMYFFYAWLPLDDNIPLDRNLSSLLQVLYFETSVLYVVGWDIFIISLLMFMVGHLKALRVRCLIAVESCEDNSLRNIAECHQQYVDLMTCYRKLNSLMSPVMFMHLLLVTINLGVCIIVLIYRKEDLTELITVFQLIVAIMIQMVFCYWLTDEVVIQHELLLQGVFESDWVESTPRVRKLVLMLAAGMNCTVVFTAGPFNEMSRVAIISILKAAYSFYTLFSTRR